MNEDLRRTPFAPSPPRVVRAVLAPRVRSWAARELLQPLVEPVLHPSARRVRALGVCTLAGHPLFWLIWARWLPQPYENLPLRLAVAALGLGLLGVPDIRANAPRRAAAVAFSLILWLSLPCFFVWMYLANGGNAVWLASLGAMFLIYYHLTDWRLATLGSATGLLFAWLLFQLTAAGAALPPGVLAPANAVVLAFCWFMGITLGLSGSNPRREQLESTLGTMAVMAHELRTPLATVQLIGDALRNEAHEPRADRERLGQLAQRLRQLVRNMNHQIDLQITNARLLRLARNPELVSAAQLVQQVVADYPFRGARERASVEVRVRRDFRFQGSSHLFGHVLGNLTKNALRSLAAASAASRPGDLLIEVDHGAERGRIVFSDRGVGMRADLQARIFQPFVSTDRGTAHGLGLAFCQRVVQAARGTIRVKSAPHQGATFTIELPLA